MKKATITFTVDINPRNRRGEEVNLSEELKQIFKDKLEIHLNDIVEWSSEGDTFIHPEVDWETLKVGFED